MYCICCPSIYHFDRSIYVDSYMQCSTKQHLQFMRLLDMIHKNYDEDRGPYMHALNMIQLTTHAYIQVQILYTNLLTDPVAGL